MSKLQLFVVHALCFLLFGCGGSGGDVPVVVPPIVDAITFDDGGALATQEQAIRTIILDTRTKANVVLPLGNIPVMVSADASRTIPGWGIGGYTLGSQLVEIVIDPTFPNLAQVLQDRLPHIAAHEFHHAVRWRGVGVYQTLIEAFVFEGMADQFAIELLATAVPPWSNAFPEGDTAQYFDRAALELDSVFDFEAWFFGVNTDLPQWTGYTLGFRLIRDYLSANPATTAADLVNTPAQDFRESIPSSGVNSGSL